ncbi:DUF3782 domain-containing protein, partial [Metallosphaera javensis (ex Hofmann et al. 2022)]|uniref:DUF3782 domain-containing protein n=1 Tax=Metallosphaera javensis (ex Hofmann et al. 2022) TaxID=99938 RepID=UPI001EDCEC56
EAQRKSEERMSKLEEKMMELAEAQRKTEEAQRKSEERMSKLEEKMMELAEAQRKMEEVLGTLTRTVGQLTEEMRQMRRDMERMNRTLDSIGRRWGLDYEELIRGFFSDFVKQEGLDFTYVNKFTYKDSTGKYGKKGLKYEIDILAKDDKVYLVEVKSFAEEDDVEWFDRKSDVVIDVLGIKNFVKLFLAVNTTEDTVKVAEELGIRMIYGGIIEERKRESSTGKT